MLLGKLSIGILEEDNPLKSYFRLKPVLLINEGAFEVFDGTVDYPEDGCLRIVPDKNESGRFKARMRRMGRYCLLDLRCHPTANDKIRTNKNFSVNPSEHNANIVYSDVIREPIEGMILDIASDTTDSSATTPQVLIGESCDIYKPVEDADGNFAYLAPDGTILDAKEIRRFEVAAPGGGTLKFAVRVSDEYIPALTGPVPEPVVPASNPPEAGPETVSVPEASVSKPEPAPTVKADEKLRDDVRKLFNSHTGLNPRGRMSLKEIIDAKWCQSREDQLGHPVPGSAMGLPMESPVELAVRAIRDAWQNPETRAHLADTIAGMSDVVDLLGRNIRSVNEEALHRALEDLEADRLMALSEIDRLRREKNSLREAFKSEIRTEEAELFAEAVAKTKAANEQLSNVKAQLAKAQSDADAVRDVLSSLNDGRFDAELRAYAVRNRCADTLLQLSKGDPCPPRLPEVYPDRAECMKLVRDSFERCGIILNDIETANLLVCTAISGSIILSGSASSDRRAAAEALAEALGSRISDRFLIREPDIPISAALYEKLRVQCDIPGIILTVGLNLKPDSTLPAYDPASGFISIAEISDTGCPVTNDITESSWLIRIKAPSADDPWNITADAADADPKPVSFKALRKAMLSSPADIPEALNERFLRVRRALAVHGITLSRSTLNDMWKYCGAMQAACRISPGETLDRAFAQRALPGILSTASIECLKALPAILEQLPISASLLNEPLPIHI